MIQKVAPYDMLDKKIQIYDKATSSIELYEVDESRLQDVLSQIQFKHYTFLKTGKE